MKRKRVIVWFRQDLRIHDNEALTDALKSGEEVIPVYVFDKRVFCGHTRFGFRKTDKFRAKFILESVADLRNTLRAKGSELIVRIGNPEQEVYKIARQTKSSWVFCNRERTQEEVDVQDALEENLWSVGQEIIYSRGKMLYYTQDLPFPVTHCPDSFTAFRKEVEKIVPLRLPLEIPQSSFNPLTVEVESGEIPTLTDLGYEEFEQDPRAGVQFKGGESEGLERLKNYFWKSDSAKTYLETKDQLIGSSFSTKLSPWLAQGCLSPKMIYHELKKYEAENGASKSTYRIFFELLWRDFFRLMGKKHGNKIFLKGGILNSINNGLKNESHLLKVWTEGRTGIPFVDANMKELARTGYMSNRGRQNVANFLIKDLKVNWQMGAEYFESLLIDYDPCSNWGNWNYVAGIGNDHREDRYFNILKQAERYDPKGEYVKLWLPELREVPADKIHLPEGLSETEQIQYHVKIGNDYPKAMIHSGRWG